MDAYLLWFANLPMWGQVFIKSFAWPFVPWLMLAIWEQRSFADRQPHQMQWWKGLLLFIAAFYLRNSTEWGRAAVDWLEAWPGQHIPLWDKYWFSIIGGGLLSGMVAKQVAIVIVGSRGDMAGSPYPPLLSMVRVRRFRTVRED